MRRFWTVSDRFRIVLHDFCGIFVGFFGVVDGVVIVFVVIAVIVVGGGGPVPPTPKKIASSLFCFFAGGSRDAIQTVLAWLSRDSCQKQILILTRVGKAA